MNLEYKPFITAKFIREDYPLFHHQNTACPSCSTPERPNVVHREGPACCKHYDEATGFAGIEYMYVIGVWPWLFWCCPTCWRKIEHETQIAWKAAKAYNNDNH